MKNKLILPILSLFFFNQLYSQKEKTVFVKVKDYEKRFHKKLTKKDSLNFKIIHNDTLVEITNYKAINGVSVPYELKDSLFLEQYKKIAFKHKKESVSEKTRMKYWKKPIKIYFSKTIQKKTRKKFLKFTSYLSKNVDSLHISEVKKIENSNYIIYYKGDFEYESRMVNYKNTDYYMYWNNNSQIYKCALKINAEELFNEKLKLYKLKDYFFRSLGNFKLSDKLNCNNFFADCYSENKKITEFDFDFLKYHYSYGICKGTSLKTFEEQHKRSKKIIKKGGKISFKHFN